VPEAGLATFPNARIVRGDVMRIADWLDTNDFTPDVVVAGELIEHVENPLALLRGLASTEKLRGRMLVLSTPNATSFHNLAVGLLSR
jgi:2-polyprenyl-3-methyl-5-hydroxy-6-metoxy-1,4-benzoquinol methylase